RATPRSATAAAAPSSLAPLRNSASFRELYGLAVTLYVVIAYRHAAAIPRTAHRKAHARDGGGNQTPRKRGRPHRQRVCPARARARTGDRGDRGDRCCRQVRRSRG